MPDGLIRFPDTIDLIGSSTFLPVTVVYAMLATDRIVRGKGEIPEFQASQKYTWAHVAD